MRMRGSREERAGLKPMKRGKAFAKSLAGDTTFAAILTAIVATTTVNIEMATMSGEENRATSNTGSQMA